ncbi:hypothetical protein [Mesorhizobium sangaii]|uniref:Uncharacterized protein n=1 Tax=Mesorhizobium sangaii TaxID=505389 RepID=A0A841PL69_9HYPH|nr:hypothetical protein [Mesorhizobium sangaii]MBB6410829.1 hypothetical protein [Mesorhizobium sangaii]
MQQKAAAKLEAKRAAVTKASGIVAAKEARRAAFERLADTVMETMGHDASTMGGVVIKALALDTWSRHADLVAMMMTPGASTWGQDLAASVLRLAGDA